MITVLENIAFTLDNDVYVLMLLPHQKKEVFNVIDVYNPAFYNGGKMRQKIIGKYSEEYGFIVNQTGLKYTDRKDMSDVKLRATITVIKFFGESLLKLISDDRILYTDFFSVASSFFTSFVGILTLR